MRLPNYLFDNTLRNQAVRIALGNIFTQPGITNYSDATIAAEIGSSETTVRRYRHAAKDAGLYNTSTEARQIDFPYFAVNTREYLYLQMKHHISKPYDEETRHDAQQILDAVLVSWECSRDEFELLMQLIQELDAIVELKKELNERKNINCGMAIAVKISLQARC